MASVRSKNMLYLSLTKKKEKVEKKKKEKRKRDAREIFPFEEKIIQIFDRNEEESVV